MNDWEKMRISLDRVADRIRTLGWANIRQEERDAANVDAFYGCVLNGGFDSLFFNSSYLGDMADELAQSLDRVLARRAAAFLREAIAQFPGGRVPPTIDGRVIWLRASKRASPFDEISRRFYAEAEKEEAVLLTFFAREFSADA